MTTVNIAFCDTEILKNISNYGLTEYVLLSESISHEAQAEIKTLETKKDFILSRIKSGDTANPYRYNDKKELEQELKGIEDKISYLKKPKQINNKTFKIGVLFHKKYKDWKFVKGAYEKLSSNKKPSVVMLLPDSNISYELDENEVEIDKVVAPSDISNWNKCLKEIISDSDALILIIEKRALNEDYRLIVDLVESSKKPFRKYIV